MHNWHTITERCSWKMNRPTATYLVKMNAHSSAHACTRASAPVASLSFATMHVDFALNRAQTILHGALNTHLFNKLRVQRASERSLYMSAQRFASAAFCRGTEQKAARLGCMHKLHRGCILPCANCSQQSHYRSTLRRAAFAHLTAEITPHQRRQAKHAQSNGAAVAARTVMYII
jgi:hypothetical protein